MSTRPRIPADQRAHEREITLRITGHELLWFYRFLERAVKSEIVRCARLKRLELRLESERNITTARKVMDQLGREVP